MTWRLYNGETLIAETEDEPVWRSAGKWKAKGLSVTDPKKRFVAKKVRTALSPMEFMLRFTPDERIAIEASDDAVVKDWLKRLADVRLRTVDVTLPQTASAMAYLAAADPVLLAESRIPEVLAEIEE